MYQIHDYHNASLMLSEILDDIGINKRIVIKRRKNALLFENMSNVFDSICGLNKTTHVYGSLSEGTTTLGLVSDMDTLFFLNDWHALTDLTEWDHGVNFLMIQEENVSPGYCLLQVVSGPLPAAEPTDVHFNLITDKQGRVLLSHFDVPKVKNFGATRHGPSVFWESRLIDKEIVFAIRCKSSPHSVNQWLNRSKCWPTNHSNDKDSDRESRGLILTKCLNNTRCYVVPKGNMGSVNENLEWRISTSEAERCIMFNMNMTQIKVYVLMKMLLKTKINVGVPDENLVSSFMCKTVLIHCIDKSYRSDWKKHNLLIRLQYCLSELLNCILLEYCPHFIISSNNLMARKFSATAKCKLLDNIDNILHNILDNGIQQISIDNVGNRILHKAKFVPYLHMESIIMRDMITQQLVIDIGNVRQTLLKEIYNEIHTYSTEMQIELLLKYVIKLKQFENKGNATQNQSYDLIIRMFYTLLGSLLASESIKCHMTASAKAIGYLSLGSNSASSRLKLATVYYCEDDMDKAEAVLRAAEKQYDFNVCESVCLCYKEVTSFTPSKLPIFIEDKDENDIEKLMSTCVIYLPNEMVPKELQFEMFRTTRYEQKFRQTETLFQHFMPGCSFGWAMVDSVPYLYFLLYKTYCCLKRHGDRWNALSNLALTIDKDSNLGHRETALNLLGQCMEQENRHSIAFKFYFLSLKIVSENNAARVHICRLLNNAINR